MGLGKTVMLLSLILKSKEEMDDSINKENGTPSANKTTLVVAPLTLIAQWEAEIATKTNLSHRLHYAESARHDVGPRTFYAVDVVVTTCECFFLASMPCMHCVFVSQLVQTGLFRGKCMQCSRIRPTIGASCRTTGIG